MQIKLQNVSKSYQKGTELIQVLNNIDFSIESGTWLNITGPSGSGKTTLLRLLSAIEQADNGQVVLGHLDAIKANEEERRSFRRNSVGYIFQDFQLFEQFDVQTNVMIPLLPYEPRKVAEEKAEKLLDMVGMLHRKNHMPSQLSGGEQQRTAIARALINNPQLILCDEPTGNLDIEKRDQIIEILQEIHQNVVTIILVTHDLELTKYGDAHFEIRNGQLIDRTISIVR
ncbi:ABC transporter ATP-binding protein [Ornithinibacillus sp. BX22]|uniref:ABC transporter ATP-binding protein n=2 Tax=Ornithinibacillus TaxID=484508 RepID=A0A923RI85_9BACI|nr:MULTISPECIES: ABC transporter ATP-binding protein [Ornithinibacillus]MBC5637039.1 ABC transporter ATP-binding protein [Ornithinibacillus hominis]MBS3679750.1 ABC transporter ATP-binding protein [Ornithinibacillus massiliensis]